MGEAVSLRLPVPWPGDRAAVLERVAELETEVYRTLVGLDDEALALAERAEELSLPDTAARARLLRSDVLSRRGAVGEAQEIQLAIHARATAEGSHLLAARASLYLASTADRLGSRPESLRWADAAQRLPNDAPPGWRAEALMVLAMFTVSHVGFNHALLEHAIEQVRAVGDPILTSVTLANFGEVAAECEDLALAERLIAEALTLLRRHPSAAASLTWESIARVQMSTGDLTAADRSLRNAFRLGGSLGWCDVNGDPHLTLAELRLAQERPEEALTALAHPGRAAAVANSSWVATRELAVRARILAALGRWQDAYDAMVEYVAAYERVRSAESERVAVQSQATQTAVEERRRAHRFEQLALRDSLTGLPNRRYADDRLLALTEAAAAVQGARVPARLSLAIVDIDHFKGVNDTYSHDVGDLVLVRIAGLLLAEGAAADGASAIAASTAGGNPAAEDGFEPFAARLGGEEFVVVFPRWTHAEAVGWCEDLLVRLRGTSYEDIAPGLRVRASIGLATLTGPTDKATLLRAADDCLYDAKRAGRDRLVTATRPTGRAATR
jgi:two-component system cell cycle response regulator